MAESSPEDTHLILKLVQMDEDDWEHLLGVLKETDSDMLVVVQSARDAAKSVLGVNEPDAPFRISSRIHAVSFSPYLDLATGDPVNRFVFKTVGGESIVSDQDLEDSLWVGAVILDSVAKSVDMMVEKFGIPPERIVWGDDFEDRLALAEKAASRLRRRFEKRSGVKGKVASSPGDA